MSESAGVATILQNCPCSSMLLLRPMSALSLQAAAPLQMLINDQVIKQQQEGRSFISNLVSTFSGKKDASSLFSNPLTGRTTTAPTAAAPVSPLCALSGFSCALRFQSMSRRLYDLHDLPDKPPSP